jgi:hypothetical protein
VIFNWAVDHSYNLKDGWNFFNKGSPKVKQLMAEFSVWGRVRLPSCSYPLRAKHRYTNRVSKIDICRHASGTGLAGMRDSTSNLNFRSRCGLDLIH